MAPGQDKAIRAVKSSNKGPPAGISITHKHTDTPTQHRLGKVNKERVMGGHYPITDPRPVKTNKSQTDREDELGNST
jgi:hypothetical protein